MIRAYNYGPGLGCWKMEKWVVDKAHLEKKAKIFIGNSILL